MTSPRMTVAEIAEAIGYCEPVVRSMLERGQIPA